MFGLGAQLGIGISVMLSNKFSPQAAQVTQSMKNMASAQTQLVEQAARDYRTKALMIAGATALATKKMYEGVEVGAAYGKQIQKIAILAEGKLGKNQLKKLSMNLSDAFGMDPQQTAAALFENVKAGVTSNIDLITKYQIAVSRATDETLEGEQGVAKGLLNIANAMGMSYEKFPQVANAVTVAANQSQASVSSLNEAMKYTANTSYRAGYGLEKTLAGLAMLSQMGIEGSSAGTAMSNMIRYSAKAGGPFSTKRQGKALAMLGMTPKDLSDSKGNLKDMLEILDMMSARLKGMGTTKQLGIIEALFGVRGEKSAINLMGKDGRGFSAQRFYSEILAGEKKDIALKQANEMMDNLAGDFAKAKAKWMQFLIQFTEAVEPLMRKLVPMLTKFIGGMISFVSSPVGKVLANVAMVFMPLISALFLLRAAAITAAFALGSSSTGSSFGQIFQGLLGGMGQKGMAARGLGSLTMNKAGNWYVKAGQTFSHGGQMWKAGQLLPKSVLSNVGLASKMAGYGQSAIGIASLANMFRGTATATAAGAVAARGGLAIAGRIVGFLGGPWGMAISAAMIVIPLIWDWLKGKKKEDKTLKGYLPNGYYGIAPKGYDEERVRALNRIGMGAQANKELINNLTININGNKAYQGTVQADQENDVMLNQLNGAF